MEGKCEGGNALGGYLAPLLRDDALHLSVKTGTALEASHVSLRKWAFAVHLEVTSLKGVSSMKLHRDLGVTPKTAWFMLHRLREAWAEDRTARNRSPVPRGSRRDVRRREEQEQAEAQAPEDRRRDHREDRRGRRQGSRHEHDSGVGGCETDWETLSRYVRDRITPETTVYTDDHLAYRSVSRHHATVKHSMGE